MNYKKASAITGFVILGLSPSFVDWQQSPRERGRMIVFYIVAVTLIYYGVLKG